LFFLNLGTELAQILNPIKGDPPTLRYIPDPSNVYRAKATNRMLCDAVRKAPILEMNVFKENTALDINILHRDTILMEDSDVTSLPYWTLDFPRTSKWIRATWSRN
jgi:hypothetical protein